METEPQPTNPTEFNADQYVGKYAVRYANVYSDDEQFPFAD